MRLVEFLSNYVGLTLLGFELRIDENDGFKLVVALLFVSPRSNSSLI